MPDNRAEDRFKLANRLRELAADSKAGPMTEHFEALARTLSADLLDMAGTFTDFRTIEVAGYGPMETASDDNLDDERRSIRHNLSGAQMLLHYVLHKPTLIPPDFAERLCIAADGISRQPATATPGGPTGAIHSADFTSVDWFGTAYTFDDGLQAKAVGCLWAEFAKGGLGLSEKTVGEAIGSTADNYRLPSTFRNHAAWGTMIVKVQQGIYRLKKPE